MSPAKSNENLDITKIYLFGTAAVNLLFLGWLLYNYFAMAYCHKEFHRGVADLQQILEAEKTLPPKVATVGREIDNVFEFFKRTVRGLGEIPEVQDPPSQLENIDGVQVEEKQYVVHFNQIPRSELGRYIYKIQEAKPFLRVKTLEIQRPDNVAAHEDRWKAEIAFAFRQKK